VPGVATAAPLAAPTGSTCRRIPVISAPYELPQRYYYLNALILTVWLIFQ
jgi:hypothetical protein